MATTSIDITANDNTARAFASVTQRLKGLASSITPITAGLTALTGALSGFGAAAAIRGVINSNDELVKIARSAGVGVEAMAGLEFAFGQSGISAERGAAAMQRFASVIDSAAEGSTAAQQKLARLGLDFAELKRLSPEEQFIKLSGAISQLSKQDQSVATIQLLGRSMGDMVNVLGGGEQALRDFIKRGQELNPVTQAAAEQAEKFNDAMDALGRSVKTLAIESTSSLIPALSTIASEMAEAARQGGIWRAVMAGVAESYRQITGTSTAGLTQMERVRGEMNQRLNKIKELRGEIAGVESSFLRSDLSKALKVQTIQTEIEGLNAEITGLNKTYKQLFETANAAPAATPKNLLSAIDDDDKPAPARRGGGAKAVKDKISESERLIESLRRQAAEVGKTREEIAREEAARLGVSESAEKYLTVIRETESAQNAQREASGRVALALSEVDKIQRASADGIGLFALELTRLDGLLADGLNIDAYSTLLKQAKTDMEAFGEEGKSQISDLDRAIQQWGRRSSDALADFAISGKASFGDFAKSVLKEIASMIIQQKILGPLFATIGGAIGGSSIFGGGRATGGPVRGGKIYEVNERGTPELLNAGSKQFLMMPTSLSGNVTPIAAGAGSSSGGGTGGAGGGIKVNIIESPGKGGQIEQRQTQQGVEIDVMLDQMIAKKQAQRDSSSGRSLRSTFGLSDPLVSR